MKKKDNLVCIDGGAVKDIRPGRLITEESLESLPDGYGAIFVYRHGMVEAWGFAHDLIYGEDELIKNFVGAEFQYREAAFFVKREDGSFICQRKKPERRLKKDDGKKYAQIAG